MDQKVLSELLHPVRIKIIQIVLQSGETTAKEISERMPEIPIATLYRHVKKLIDIGAFEVTSELQVRGTIEKRLKVKINPIDAINKLIVNSDANIHFEVFYSFIISLLNDFSQYISEPNYDLVEDQVGFRVCPLYMSDIECEEFLNELKVLLEKYMENKSEEKRRLRNISITMIPSKNK